MSGFPCSVLHFTITCVRGGVEEHILLLLRGLDRRYFRPILVCPPELAAKFGADLPADIECVTMQFQKPSQVKTAYRFAQVLRKHRVEILHSHMFQASRLASPIGRLCGVPLIIETPHVREQWRHGWFKGSYATDRLLGRFVDHYVAVSEGNARYLVDEKGLPAEKVHVIRNGCNLKRLDSSRLAHQGIKQSLGFAEDDPVLLVLGRLEPQKGHRVLLEALPYVRREFSRIRLVCVGEGCLRQELEQQARALGLQESVRFVGFRSNVADWLALADISVLPSFYEGLPLVAVESLAAGRPMVATAVDGTNEVVVNERTGLTVPPGDPEQLAGAILRLLRQPEWAKELALAGREWVRGHFSEEQQVMSTQEFYLDVLGATLDCGAVADTRHRVFRQRKGRQGFVGRDSRVRVETGMTKGLKLEMVHLESAREPHDAERLAAAICEETARECNERFGGNVLALVLTGSLARDEGTFTTQEEGLECLGDAEFYLVFRRGAILPSPRVVKKLCHKIQRALSRRDLACQVDLSAVSPNYLRHLPPHILTYELRANGRVVSGDSHVLELIPAFSASEISREDAWRLLCNRIVELLEVAPALSNGDAGHTTEPRYQVVKLYLDMATSFLVFAGAYAPTYRERAMNLERLAEAAGNQEGWPFEIRPFAERVSAFTDWKLSAVNAHVGPLQVAWQEAIRYARHLWRWELALLTGVCDPALTDRKLLQRWMRLQAPPKRLRGWLHVVRRCGWHRSWRNWPRWAQSARRASPRYWVYAAASELLPWLPGLLSAEVSWSEGNRDFQELLSWLPLLKEAQDGNGSVSWQQLVSEIAWNYHTFLEKTRA
jgi:glycosyltransferase involved in cell wall biosynthesis